jgi:hypothetical protein
MPQRMATMASATSCCLASPPRWSRGSRRPLGGGAEDVGFRTGPRSSGASVLLRRSASGCGVAAGGAGGWPDRVFAEEALARRHDGSGDDEGSADGASLRAGSAAEETLGDLSRDPCASVGFAIAGGAAARGGGRWRRLSACGRRWSRGRGIGRRRRRGSVRERRDRGVAKAAGGAAGSGAAAGAAWWWQGPRWASAVFVGSAAGAGVRDRGFGLPEVLGAPSGAGWMAMLASS